MCILQYLQRQGLNPAIPHLCCLRESSAHAFGYLVILAPSAGTVIRGELCRFFSGWRNLRPGRTVACCGDGYFSALVISCKKHFERRKLPRAALKKMNRKRNRDRDDREATLAKRNSFKGFCTRFSHPSAEHVFFFALGLKRVFLVSSCELLKISWISICRGNTKIEKERTINIT